MKWSKELSERKIEREVRESEEREVGEREREEREAGADLGFKNGGWKGTKFLPHEIITYFHNDGN